MACGNLRKTARLARKIREVGSEDGDLLVRNCCLQVKEIGSGLVE